MRTRFVNLRIPSGGNEVEPAELVVEGGRIVAVLPAGTETAAGDERWVNLDGALVLPGAIDGHVHFHDGSSDPREDFASGTAAAAAGGVTCVVERLTSDAAPGAADVERLLSAVGPTAHVDFMVWAGLDGRHLADDGWPRRLWALAEAGVAGVAVALHSDDPAVPPVPAPALRPILEETAACALPVAVYAEDGTVVADLERRVRDRGDASPAAWAEARPAAAEVAAVSTVVHLCRATGAPVHLLRIAAGEALDLASAARFEGLPVTVATCPHLLEFSRSDLESLGSVLKTVPAVRSEADLERLWQGLGAGEIDLVASDHDPARWPDEKSTGSIWTDRAGLPGVELLLPYLYTAGYCSGRLTLERLVELISTTPARLLGIDHRKGRLERGFDADFVVFDERTSWTVRGDRLHGLSRYTPFEGRVFTGRVRATYLRGRAAYQATAEGDELFGAAGAGIFLARGMG